MATYYIDPTAVSDGVGTSKSDPWNTWSGKSFSAGNTYLQKAGTTYEAEILLGGTGTLGNIIIIGSYTDTQDRSYKNSTRPVLDGTSTTAKNGINAVGKAYYIIEEFEIRNFDNNGINNLANVTRSNDNVIIDDCVVHDNGLSGIYFNLTNHLTDDPNSNGVIKNCICYNNGYFGIGISAAADNFLVNNCTCYSNGSASNSWEIWAQSDYTLFTTGWTSEGGGVYSRAFTDPLVTIYQHATHVILTDGGATSTPSVGQYGITGGNLYVNTGSDANTVSIYAQHRETKNITFKNCTAYNNASTDSVNIGLDQQAAGKIIGCITYGADIGFELNATYALSTIQGCIAYNCNDWGISPLRCYDAAIINNTIYNCGIGIEPDGGDSIGHIANNIVYDCNQGIQKNFISGWTEKYNLLNNTTNFPSGSLDSTSIEADPLLDSEYYPHLDSPAIQAGAWTGVFTTDYGGRPFKRSRPTIGAWEIASRDPVNRNPRE